MLREIFVAERVKRLKEKFVWEMRNTWNERRTVRDSQASLKVEGEQREFGSTPMRADIDWYLVREVDKNRAHSRLCDEEV